MRFGTVYRNWDVRTVRVGDLVSSAHGNVGVVSKIYTDEYGNIEMVRYGRFGAPLACIKIIARREPSAK